VFVNFKPKYITLMFLLQNVNSLCGPVKHVTVQRFTYMTLVTL